MRYRGLCEQLIVVEEDLEPISFAVRIPESDRKLSSSGQSSATSIVSKSDMFVEGGRPTKRSEEKCCEANVM